MGLELDFVRVDDLAAAVLALRRQLLATRRGVQGLSCGDTHDRGGLGGLDGQTVGLDGRASACLVGGLVLALNLSCGQPGHVCLPGRCGHEERRRRTLSFLEMGMLAV
jgi:hypothetical protein